MTVRYASRSAIGALKEDGRSLTHSRHVQDRPHVFAYVSERRLARGANPNWAQAPQPMLNRDAIAQPAPDFEFNQRSSREKLASAKPVLREPAPQVLPAFGHALPEPARVSRVLTHWPGGRQWALDWPSTRA